MFKSKVVWFASIFSGLDLYTLFSLSAQFCCRPYKVIDIPKKIYHKEDVQADQLTSFRSTKAGYGYIEVASDSLLSLGGCKEFVCAILVHFPML